MVNLEWYRTFKAVYKHRNYSKAAEELFITQPAVSNQMKMLEAYVGHKLFIRKSKGVEATENAKFLNNLIIESLDTLEEVESMYSRRVEKEEQLYVLGISEHLYRRFLAGKLTSFRHLSIQFEERNEDLIRLVDHQEIDAAIIHQEVKTFDILSHKILSSPLVIVGHPEIDTSQLDQHLRNGDLLKAQRWLEHQTWFSHMSTNPFIKLFWLHCFKKRRPKVFTNYVIPNEYFMLQELEQTHGVCVTLLENAREFLDKGSLQLIWQSHDYPQRDYFLIAHKKQKGFFDSLKELLG
ncbi:LysR family transcriptional regulator [Pontibacter sp. G13]|uniref:LysR family transcriptional regulator n=1 Tax=Pontibacter sp. G13 TaxID=3074898 RepID=UPI002889FDA7|nr:LysR family transcriptional regulator [Pontibacter sp. G13]WNJ17472.1 LysR family transcriptional regulator [Pontibacter sp. G13]